MRKLKNFAKSMFVAIGVLSSVVTILWASFPSLNTYAKDHPLRVFLTVLFVSVAYGTYSNRTRRRITLKISEKVTATVYFGDLFESNEIIIIPVNEYFDTIVDDKIVSHKTLHGMFIRKFFGGNETELKQQIENGLSNCKPLEVNSGRARGNKNKYPLGTVCEVENGGLIFYLVALTRFNENDRAEVKNSEYQRVLCDLFSFVEQNSQGRLVSLPLIGAGHSGVDLSKQKLLEFLLFSISLKDSLTLINGVNIVLHDSTKGDIDLSSTETLFKTIGK